MHIITKHHKKGILIPFRFCNDNMVKQGLGENMKDWNNSIKNPNIRRTYLIKLIHLYTGNICMRIICQPEKKSVPFYFRRCISFPLVLRDHKCTVNMCNLYLSVFV